MIRWKENTMKRTKERWKNIKLIRITTFCITITITIVAILLQRYCAKIIRLQIVILARQCAVAMWVVNRHLLRRMPPQTEWPTYSARLGVIGQQRLAVPCRYIERNACAVQHSTPFGTEHAQENPLCQEITSGPWIAGRMTLRYFEQLL